MLRRYYDKCQEGAGWNDVELGSAANMEQAIWQRVQKRIQQGRVVPLYRSTWFRVVVAASILAAVSAIYWPTHSTHQLHRQPQVASMPAFKPVRVQQPSLLLSGGRVQQLSGVADGVLATDGDYVIHKKGSLLIYHHLPKPGVAAPEAYHTLALPAGSQYAVQLPDGSRVWLNAASAIRFPLHFAPENRRVALQGEAYFEVAKDPVRKFQVQPVDVDGRNRGAMVEVLGTHFNVEAYGDEQAVRTTLLEGKVKLRQDSGMGTILAPGQQAVASGNKPLVVRRVEVARVVAWQQGLFDFKGADTRQVVRQLARWYGLEVRYGRLDENLRFSGKISRRLALADVLEILGQSGLRCTVEGQTIRVGTGN